IRVERPDAALAMGSPPGGGLVADLTEDHGTITLSVRGAGKPLVRELPAAGTSCEETLQTAALMIDRYLDELRASGEEARIEELGVRRGPEFGVAIGGSVAQAPAGWAPGLTLETDLRLGPWLLSLGGEANLSQQQADSAFSGAFDLQPAAAWLAGGVAPRF